MKASRHGGLRLFGRTRVDNRTRKIDALRRGLRTGEVVICNFDTGFRPPEMAKTRPVIVISKASTHIRGLCTIVPLSTTCPAPLFPWHVLLSSNPLLGHMPADHTFCTDQPIWAKCDMIITLGFERITRPHRRVEGRRDYPAVRVASDDLAAVFDGVRAYLPGGR